MTLGMVGLGKMGANMTARLLASGHGLVVSVKMVHNGIEYGLMEAYAEGFEILKRSAE